MKTMKIKFQYIWLPIFIICFSACKKDNFSAPSSALSGKLVYKGEPILNRVLKKDEETMSAFQLSF